MSQAFVPKDAEIALPARSAKLEANVMDVYAKRASAAGADFKGQALSQQQVADLLWCAYGMNRKDVGKLTAPSTMNSQEATLYAIFPSGAYRYDNANHKLIRVATADLRKEVASMQKDMADAPLMLLVVCHPNKIPVPPAKQRECCLIDAGIVSQNISLYCAAAGLKNRPRITMDQDALRKALGLAADDMLVINHPIAL
ncbi:MAG: SagB/ThcOx family dehydrogenase [Bacteroidia bacterium]|nr:SagB/ThcOx family dehydrogenase [Bacteroidia bacterium]